MRVTFHELAKRELSDAVHFYEDKTRGRALLEQVRRAVVRLRRFPRSGPVIRGPVRRMVLTKYPYSLIYSIESNVIRVLAVAHHRREPTYWLKRT